MRVVIAEDSVLLRVGVQRLLADEGIETVAAVDDGVALLAAIEEHRPDLALVDVRMPPTFTDEGLRAAIEARKRIPNLPVLVLSQYVEERYAVELLAGGASGVGYLLKERVGRVERFLEALHRVAAGGTAMDPEVISQLLVRRTANSPLDALTAREREVLGLMAEGLSNTTIGDRLAVSDAAVHKHIRNIFTKLDLPHDDNGGHRRVLAVLTYLDG